MILGALIAGDVLAFCVPSCKIRFGARVRTIVLVVVLFIFACFAGFLHDLLWNAFL